MSDIMQYLSIELCSDLCHYIRSTHISYNTNYQIINTQDFINNRQIYMIHNNKTNIVIYQVLYAEYFLYYVKAM